MIVAGTVGCTSLASFIVLAKSAALSYRLHITFMRLDSMAIVVLSALTPCLATAGSHDVVRSITESIALACTAVCCVTDAQRGYVFDRVTYPGLLAVLIAAAALGNGILALAGALTCGAALGSLFAATRGGGMGLGDVKLAAVIGAGFGPWLGLAALGLSFVCGGAYGAALLFAGRAQRQARLPLVPFLMIALAAVDIARGFL